MSLLILGFIALSSLLSFVSRNNKNFFVISKVSLCIALLISILAFFNLGNIFYNTINFNVLTYANLELGISFKFDTLSSLMLLVVILISIIIYQYTIRYLESDITRPRFLGQLGAITLSVSILVLSNNLLTAFIGWQFIGLALYVTLNHYHFDPFANRSAKKKFVINRIGDLSFLTAVVLCYQLYGTSLFSVILYQNNNELIGFLVFIAIMTKSAQFPFHIWLPDTMEAPTPVSALMHAGVINAGGYLLARLAPLYLENISLMLLIFLVGLITALLGNLFYFFQFDTKKKLAYSTMAQMGYMILQCGTGAFLSAVYHLIAHGFFKASLFLNAGNTLKVELKDKHIKQKPFSAIFISIILLFTAYEVMQLFNTRLPFIIWGFLYITLLQLSYKLLSINLSAGIRNLLILSLFATLLVYTLIISYLNYMMPNLEIQNNLFEVFQVSVVFIAISIQIVSWYIPSIQSPASNNKLIEQIFIRKMYFEEIYRGSILHIIRKIGDHFNNRYSAASNLRYKHPILGISAFTFIAGLLFSYSTGEQPVAINLLIITVFLFVLIITAISANRANNLTSIFYWLGIFEFTFIVLALFTDSISIQKIAFYHLMNIAPLIAMMFLLMMNKSNRKSSKVQMNKLSWHKLYVGILLILMLGVPGTATFITEIYILSGLIAMNPILGFIFALGIILLSIAVLHCLQLYIFDKESVYHSSPKPNLLTHILCWAIILLNILSGLFPNILISLFTKL